MQCLHYVFTSETYITLSVPIVLFNSFNLSQYFSLKKLKRILLCLISLHFLITNVLFCMCYVRRNWVLISDQD